jgi:putative ABC transport system ATP-binding protein/macrolide transport system ATP-binding/permease protein
LAREELLGEPDDDRHAGPDGYRADDPYDRYTRGYPVAGEPAFGTGPEADLLGTGAPVEGGPAEGVAALCRGVGKVYVTEDEEVDALSGVDKDFPRAEVSAIVGPSGSGKSSLLRILACVDRPTTGAVRIAGTEVAGLGARGRRALRRTAVAYVFQNPMDNLVEYLDAAAQVRLAGRLRGTRPDRDEVDRLLRLLGLDHRADHRPAQLSGGEQQRLAFACAVVGRPAIVVADEPTAELDSASADRVLAAVRDLTGEGVAFILSSHDPRVTAAADHLLRLDRGRVVESW